MSIDKQRVEAVRQLESMGWRWKDNRWVHSQYTTASAVEEWARAVWPFIVESPRIMSQDELAKLRREGEALFGPAF